MLISSDSNLKKKIKKILLILPQGKIKITKDGSRERKLAVPSLGLGYLAAVLLRNGLEVSVLDTLVEGFLNERSDGDTIIYGLGREDIKKRIKEYDPDLVGVSCIMSNRSKEVLDICRIAKETVPDAHVLVGGQHPTGLPGMISDSNIDYILRGESENSIVRLVDAINSRGNLADVDGIVVKTNGGIHVSGSMDYPDLKSIPYPAWEILKLEDYWSAGMSDYEISGEGSKKFITMMTSRGCPHNCYYCTSAMMSGRKFRQRELESVVSEIRMYKEKYGVEEIHFWDDNFFINKERVKKLLRCLCGGFPDMRFQVPSGSEANALDDEVIELLAKAGFGKLFVAVESPNEKIQDKLIDKKVNVNSVKHIVKKIKEAGMISEGSFMIGFPGETKEQIDRAFEVVTKFGFDRISVSIVNPLPGTLLYEQCRRENLLYDDFNENDIRWSSENIRLAGVERGYISRRRREVWLKYMKDRIDIDKYENEKVISTFKERR